MVLKRCNRIGCTFLIIETQKQHTFRQYVRREKTCRILEF